MFGLLSRSVRRPRTVQSPIRTQLRMESLEARANPAAPVLSGVSVAWSGESVAVITGTIHNDEAGSTILHVSGAANQTVQVGPGGQFMVTVRTDGHDTLRLAAENGSHLFSTVREFEEGEGINPPQGEQAAIGNISITQDTNGNWHIRGNLNAPGTSQIGNIIRIVSGGTGEANVADDGSFDIVVNMDPGVSGGGISIIAIDGNGDQIVGWDGTIG